MWAYWFLTVKILVLVAHLLMVEHMVSEGTWYYIHSDRVSIFSCRCPIVLFDQLLCLPVFTSQEPVSSIGCCPFIISWYVDGHGRKDLCPMIQLPEYVFRFGMDKICCTYNSDILESLNTVNIHESSIKNSYCHSLAVIPPSMQCLSPKHFHLFFRHSIFWCSLCLGHAAPLLPDIQGLLPVSDAIRWFPYYAWAPHEGHLCNSP